MGKTGVKMGPWLEGRKRWVQPEHARSSAAELTALTVEARRRGITYGQLAERTCEAERREIVRAYLAERRQEE